MELIEYVVVLNQDINYAEFWEEIENQSETDGFAPSRRVDIANSRNGMRRLCHYFLTADEAELLEQDERVMSVEIDVDQDDSIIVGNHSTQTLGSTETTNWGLLRCNFRDRTETIDEDFSYSLDGTGVDVVVVDSGIVADHPEWEDANGVSRLQKIDWFLESGVSGTMDIDDFYLDTSGHGTHCTGIAAGKTFGWAKNAHIYSIAMSGLRNGNPNGLGTSELFDCILGWHNNKPVDPATGFKRPTIVNCSWGTWNYNDWPLTSITWRGQAYNPETWGSSQNDLRKFTGMQTNYFSGRKVPATSNSLSAALQECIDAGVHFSFAAGNDFITVSAPDGPDYNNSFDYYVDPARRTFTNLFSRKSAPYSVDMFNVGNLNLPLDTESGLETPSGDSNSGTATNIYAPGDQIMSAHVNGDPYSGNSEYNQKFLSGTSMASPQIVGMGALVLQANPHATPQQLIAHMQHNATSGKINPDTTPHADWTITTGEYSETRHLRGSKDLIAYNIFNKPNKTSIRGE